MKTTSHPHFMTSGTPSHTVMNFVIWVKGYILFKILKPIFKCFDDFYNPPPCSLSLSSIKTLKLNQHSNDAPNMNT